MDALSATLATIVGLICNFRQERGAQEALDHRKFIEWLEYHRHEELKNLIANTHHLQTEVDALLREDHVVMLSKLGEIERMLSTLLSRVSGFDQLARTLHPQWELSDQALEILTMFAESGAQLMVVLSAQDGPMFGFPVPGTGKLPMYKPGEARFFEDDMASLVSLGLVTQDYGSRGDPQFRLTRVGARYVRELAQKPMP